MADCPIWMLWFEARRVTGVSGSFRLCADAESRRYVHLLLPVIETDFEKKSCYFGFWFYIEKEMNKWDTD